MIRLPMMHFLRRRKGGGYWVCWRLRVCRLRNALLRWGYVSLSNSRPDMADHDCVDTLRQDLPPLSKSQVSKTNIKARPKHYRPSSTSNIPSKTNNLHHRQLFPRPTRSTKNLIYRLSNRPHSPTNPFPRISSSTTTRLQYSIPGHQPATINGNATSWIVSFDVSYPRWLEWEWAKGIDIWWWGWWRSFCRCGQ